MTLACRERSASPNTHRARPAATAPCASDAGSGLAGDSASAPSLVAAPSSSGASLPSDPSTPSSLAGAGMASPPSGACSSQRASSWGRGLDGDAVGGEVAGAGACVVRKGGMSPSGSAARSARASLAALMSLPCRRELPRITTARASSSTSLRRETAGASVGAAASATADDMARAPGAASVDHLEDAVELLLGL